TGPGGRVHSRRPLLRHGQLRCDRPGLGDGHRPASRASVAAQQLCRDRRVQSRRKDPRRRSLRAGRTHQILGLAGSGRGTLTPPHHYATVGTEPFSPHARYLAAIKAPDWSKNPELLVWEVASGRAVIRVRHTGPYYWLRETARFRPDSRAVTTRDVNGVLRLWEVPSGKLLEERPLDGDGGTRFSPDGRVVAAAANLGVRLLDGDNLAALHAGYLPHPDPITDVAFSPDGAFLLVGYGSGSAQLWEVATRKPVGPPAVLLGAIRAVTFTPDGKTCLCVAADGTVRRWPVPAPLAEPDLDRLADCVALMPGQRMDENQGLDPVPAGQGRALRAKLVGDGSTALVPPRPDADWHDAVAADAEQDGDAFGAEWHPDRLAAPRPQDSTRAPRPPAAAGSWRRRAAATRPTWPTRQRAAWPRPRRCCPIGCGPPLRTTRRLAARNGHFGTWTGPSG